MDIQIGITHTTGTHLTTPIVPADRFTYTLLPALSDLTFAGLPAAPHPGTLQINGAAPSGGSLVTLALAPSSPAGVVQFPSSVTVPAGAESVSVPVTILNANYNGSISIVATCHAGSIATGTITQTILQTPPPPAIVLSTTTALPFTAGMTSSVTLTLGAPAPAGGAVVSLSSSNAGRPGRCRRYERAHPGRDEQAATATITSEYFLGSPST